MQTDEALAAEKAAEEEYGIGSPEALAAMSGPSPAELLQAEANIGIAGYLRKSKVPFCGRCGVQVPRVGPDAVGVVCLRCTNTLANVGRTYKPANRKPARVCPDCEKKPLAPRRRYCLDCAKKRQRDAKRRAAQSARKGKPHERRTA